MTRSRNSRKGISNSLYRSEKKDWLVDKDAAKTKANKNAEIKDHKMKLQERIQKEEKDIDSFKAILEKFPDAEIRKDRWQKEYFYSALAEEFVDSVDFYHLCGCCADAAYNARLYVANDGNPVYFMHFGIFMGNKNPYSRGYYARRIEKVEEDLAKLKIPQNIKDKILSMSMAIQTSESDGEYEDEY